MRNIEELLNKIDKHAEVGFRVRHRSPKRRCILEYESDQYFKQLDAIKGRISNILTVANHALDKGMYLTEHFIGENYESGMLFSTIIKRQMGLIICPLDDKLYLGFNREGTDIPTNFMTNGEEAFEYNRYSHRKEKASPYSLKYFFLAFEAFEEGFYKYIEEECDYYDPDLNKEAIIEYYLEKKEKESAGEEE